VTRGGPDADGSARGRVAETVPFATEVTVTFDHDVSERTNAPRFHWRRRSGLARHGTITPPATNHLIAGIWPHLASPY
jgi:hypothetical protein